MNNSQASIISDDAQFVADVRDVVGQTLASPLDDVSVASYIEGGTSVLPDWLLLDLRTLEDCQRLLGDAHKQLHAAKKTTQLIGIVGRGYPLEWTGVASRTLYAAFLWPAEKPALQELLAAAPRRSNDRHALLNGAHRKLQGSDRHFVTYTPSLFHIVEEVAVAARHDVTILLMGETGTGKTTLARLIHELSPRRARPFVTVACGTLPRETVGSELFGHVKGAFTGADRTKLGKFDVANGGTMLLDEIEVLELEQQAKLLRVIESGEFEPLGSNETRVTDSRLIVACNVNLEDLIAQHRFRRDLYFRLSQLKFTLPPLRNRERDIVPLAVDIIRDCCDQEELAVDRVQPKLLQLLCAYDWPGNIRELRNELRRAVIFCRDQVLTPCLMSVPLQRVAARAENGNGSTSRSGLAEEVGQAERDVIEQMLRSQQFNRAATARALGISRVTLYNKIRKYGISMGSDA